MTITEPRAIQQRFLALNRERLGRALAALPQRQRPFIEVLPVLFHTNHPALPGFVSRDAPYGVAAYYPSDQALTAAGRVARTFDYKRRVPLTYDVDALYLMGSPGTLAYSEHSDFDIWLCHREDLPETAVEVLHRKAEGVAQWAATLDLEVHFYLMSAADARAGRFHGLSEQSSGSAQRQLLLDEFYRTALLVAGRQPLWWLVPPEHDGEYEAYGGELLRRRFVDPAEVLDFGGLQGVPANEFLGAALWQLYKAVSSPYKSLLKILLLESYASEFPNPGLLAQRFKAAVYAGTRHLDRLDPYALMLEKVEGYLVAQGDRERLELAHRCLYFKTGQHLSRPRPPAQEDPRPAQLRALVQAWHWSDAQLQNLDLRDDWKLERVVDDRQRVVRALTRSYRALSAFARQHAPAAAISQRDMTILGRRLFAAFEHRVGKVQWIGGVRPGQLAESHLVLQRVRYDGREEWLVFRGSGTAQGGRLLPALRRTGTLVEALVWCHFNGVATERTSVALEGEEQSVFGRELPLTLGALRRTFPAADPGEPSVEALAAPSRPLRACMLLNLGVDPLASYTRHGLHLTTDRLDPLNYGAREDNLCLAIDYVFVTSWNEVFTARYEGADGLVDCLRDWLAHAALGPVELTVHCFTPYRGPSIARRVQGLLEEAAGVFAAGEERRGTRWLMKVSDVFFSVTFEGERPRVERVGDATALHEHLGSAMPGYAATRFDRGSSSGSVLPVVYACNSPGRVQVFYQVRGAEADVYVLDENGSLFTDTVPFHEELTLLTPYARFLEAVAFRQNASGLGRPAVGTGDPLELYRLAPQRSGELAASRVTRPVRATIQPYLEVKVVVESETPQPSLRVLCDGVEYSTAEHGARLFEEVVTQVLAARGSGEPYPVYVTDVDLSAIDDRPGVSGLTPTVRYLYYKAEVERRLNQALAAQAPAPPCTRPQDSTPRSGGEVRTPPSRGAR